MRTGLRLSSTGLSTVRRAPRNRIASAVGRAGTRDRPGLSRTSSAGAGVAPRKGEPGPVGSPELGLRLPVSSGRLHHEPDDHDDRDDAAQHHEHDACFHVYTPFPQVVPSRAIQNLARLRSLRFSADDNCK
jgi:hypothetical protein